MSTRSDIKRGWLAEAQTLTQGQRQVFLDALRDGKTIGDAREVAGITFDAAMGCMEMFIEKSEVYSLAKVAP